MTDQVLTPEVTQQVQPPTPPAGVDWEARYKGASSVINDLTTKNRSLEEQLAVKASELEQLRTQLSAKDVEKVVSAGEYQKQLELALSNNSTLATELKELRTMKAKLEVAKKLNAPNLMPILDRIPYVEDPEALETIMKDFMNWGQTFAQEREKQLMAGITPTVASVSQSVSTPQTAKDWEALAERTPAGPQRDKVWKDYFEWGRSSSK